MISDDALKKFKNIWREEFGKDIANDEALKIATRLLAIFNQIYRPIKKEWGQTKNNKNSNENKRVSIKQ